MGRAPAGGGGVQAGPAGHKEELSAHLEKHFAKYQVPDDYLFMAQIPRTSTGKFLKTKLREDHGDHLLKQTRAVS